MKLSERPATTLEPVSLRCSSSQLTSATPGPTSPRCSALVTPGPVTPLGSLACLLASHAFALCDHLSSTIASQPSCGPSQLVFPSVTPSSDLGAATSPSSHRHGCCGHDVILGFCGQSTLWARHDSRFLWTFYLCGFSLSCCLKLWNGCERSLLRESYTLESHHKKQKDQAEDKQHPNSTLSSVHITVCSLLFLYSSVAFLVFFYSCLVFIFSGSLYQLFNLSFSTFFQYPCISFSIV